MVIAGTARIGTFRGEYVALRGRVGPKLVNESDVTVFVVVANPGHRKRQVIFVAPLWRKVQPVVRPDLHVESPAVTGIGVENAAVPVLVERAHAGPLLPREMLHAVVVV